MQDTLRSQPAATRRTLSARTPTLRDHLQKNVTCARTSRRTSRRTEIKLRVKIDISGLSPIDSLAKPVTKTVIDDEDQNVAVSIMASVHGCRDRHWGSTLVFV
mmetsp:Transcript_26044/g.68416  ORF Transcript_26044/g.68416 Transcript_26044/m.68416 type:complete len:103 (-) Transcript_26044:1112-1420(-)